MSDTSDSSETAVEQSASNYRVKLDLSPTNAFTFLLELIIRITYLLYQHIISFLFTPSYRAFDASSRLGRIAVIGGGVTGVASAAHCISNGFEVVIFESASELGGIWAQTNTTSGLQLNSILYRFFPSVIWKHAFPLRDEILDQLRRVWLKYDLQSCTRFNTHVHKITRHPQFSTDPNDGGHACWVINDGEEGIFDAVICAIGTCGKPKLANFQGLDTFQGKVVHSSQIDTLQDEAIRGKRVVIIGSGASGVEAAEESLNRGAGSTVLLARSDKWIIPREILFDIMLSLQPFGKEMPLSFIPEWLIRTFHYRDLKDLSPARKGIFTSTPVVNDSFLRHIREGRISYVRGSTTTITEQGVNYTPTTREGKSLSEEYQKADVIILATGFERPSREFLPEDLFPQFDERHDYSPPNLYLQQFSTVDWSCLLTNAAYMDAIGTVGNWHIGLYTRILIVFLLDKDTRPDPYAMKVWVDLIRYLKKDTFGKAEGLNFFTYAELLLFIVFFFFFRPWRLSWLPFVFFGYGRPKLKK